MRNNTYIIILAFILCLIPMNYGCSLVSKAVKLSSKTVFKNSFSKVSKYTGKYGKYVFGKGAKFFAEPAVEIKKIASTIAERNTKRSVSLISNASLLKRASVIRKRIKPNNQFVTNKNLDLDNLKNQIIGREKDANTLFKNMRANGCDVNWIDDEINVLKGIDKRSQTHHVIPPTSDCMEIMKKYNIDINDCRNGIILPQNKFCYAKGSLHGKNTTEYENYIFNQIKNCKSQTEVFDKLDDIKNALYNGKIKILSSDTHEFIN